MYFLLAIGIPGALALGHALYQIHRGRRTRTWPVVPGHIADRYVTGSLFFVPIARGSFSYTYQVGQALFCSRRIRFGSDIAFSLPNPARTWLGETYRPGSSVPVAYNPQDPADSVLRVGVSPGTYVVAACGAGMIVGAVIACGAA
jgi:hypothetical protein